MLRNKTSPYLTYINTQNVRKDQQYEIKLDFKVNLTYYWKIAKMLLFIDPNIKFWSFYFIKPKTLFKSFS